MSQFPDAKSKYDQRLEIKGVRVGRDYGSGIKNPKGYFPYEEGLERIVVFLKYPDGKNLLKGQVCARMVRIILDFTKSETRTWWAEKMAFYTEAELMFLGRI